MNHNPLMLLDTVLVLMMENKTVHYLVLNWVLEMGQKMVLSKENKMVHYLVPMWVELLEPKKEPLRDCM